MDKKFDCILADPPWSYRDKCKAGKRGAGFKYPCLSLHDICYLSVGNIADTNCILFLWSTFPMIQDAMEVVKWWGFEYKTVGFVWIKKNRKSDTDFWGMGNWTRSNSEVCLIGTKGKPIRMSASVHSVIHSPIGKHSRKPAETRTRIEKLMGPCRKVELFATEEVDGWDIWGNEVKSTITL